MLGAFVSSRTTNGHVRVECSVELQCVHLCNDGHLRFECPVNLQCVHLCNVCRLLFGELPSSDGRDERFLAGLRWLSMKGCSRI